MLSLTLGIQRTDYATENEPDMLSDAFEQGAARREQEMQDRWGS